MKNFIFSFMSITAFSTSMVYAGGFSKVVSMDTLCSIVRHTISVRPNFMKDSLRTYGTLRATIGSKPTRPMPERSSYEDMPTRVRFLDEQHERYLLDGHTIKETSKDALPKVEQKNSSTTIITPQKKK